MPQIRFEQADAQDLQAALTREWLVTNGLGGYASGTPLGINTRRYHGLLIAALHPPVQRTALLVRLDEVVRLEDETIDLMAAEYADGAIYPHGYTHLKSFSLEDGAPTWQFTAGNALLRRAIWMVPGHNITAIRYKLVAGDGPVDLALRPLTAARDHHTLQRGNSDRRFIVDRVPDGVRIQAAPDAPSLWLLARGAGFNLGGDWYWNYLLREERARGYDHIEDLYQPGVFHATLRPGSTLTLIASAEDPAQGLPDVDAALVEQRNAPAHTAAALVARPLEVAADHRRRLEELVADLDEAAQAFVVRRAPTTVGEPAPVSLMAGYHWFADWGRDAMINLPGLLLATGRRGLAVALLRTFASHIDQGMIPNRFPDAGGPAEYNTADASLWFFQALRHTLDALDLPPPTGGGMMESESQDAGEFLAELYPRLREIVDWHRRGTRYGIGVDPQDGLLRAGQAGSADVRATQLTWMDARYGCAVYTPRIGKPVEINALWIAALTSMASWAPRCDDDPEPYRRAARRAAESFVRRFWYAAGGYLYDVLDGPDGDDPSLRPNQLIALVLDEALLPEEQARSVLRVVTEKLLTPYGLRTLAPDDPRYKGQCVGDQPARDLAYHQGTVWPWLLGPYADAHRRLHGDTHAIATLLLPFHAHLREAGLGSISEIFDGDAPHTPRGCIAQGWSVAEVLRIASTLLPGPR